jgi:hypothetical protein
MSERRLGDAVNEAEVRRLFDLGSVEAALARLPGRSGRHRRRDRRLATLGIQVSRVTWPDLQEPARLAAELRAIRSERL